MPGSYARALKRRRERVEDSTPAIARLAAERFHERVWLVSRCDAEDEEPIRRWLERRDFYRRLEVLGHMIGTVPHLYLMSSPAADRARFPHLLPRVQAVSRWDAVVTALLGRRDL
jgi:hypothetical protein